MDVEQRAFCGGAMRPIPIWQRRAFRCSARKKMKHRSWREGELVFEFSRRVVDKAQRIETDRSNHVKASDRLKTVNHCRPWSMPTHHVPNQRSVSHIHRVPAGPHRLQTARFMSRRELLANCPLDLLDIFIHFCLVFCLKGRIVSIRVEHCPQNPVYYIFSVRRSVCGEEPSSRVRKLGRCLDVGGL